MNFKNISLIIPFLCVGLKVIAGPVVTEAVDSEFNEDVYSLEEDIDLDGDGVVAEISDDEIATGIIGAIAEEDECSSEECIQTSRRILGNMDISVDPCEDFYHFTCGGWESKVLSNEMSDESNIGKVKNLVNKEIEDIIKGEYTVDEKLSKEDQAYDEKTFKKLKSIYNICMNKEINESYPNEHLINFVKSFNITERKDKLKDKEELTDLFIKLQTSGVDSVVKINAANDETVSDRPIVGLTISPLIYSHSINYLVPEKLPEIIPIFKDHIKSIYTSILGENNNIDSIIDSIYETEIKLTKIINESKVFSTFIDMNKRKKPGKSEALKLSELNEKYPMINWNSYLKNIFEFFNLGEYIKDDMVIYNPIPDYYEKINQFISELSIDDLVNYLEWNVISFTLFDDYVSEDIIKIEEEFYKKIDEIVFSKLSIEEINELYGDITDIIDIDEISQTSSVMNKKFFFKSLKKRDNTQPEEEEIEKDRIKKCSTYLKNIMPMAISKYFIQKNFNDNIKNEVKEMIENVKEAMINRIPKMEWLDDETKEFAIQKVLKMKDRIGYPEDIMDPKKLYQNYENLEIDNFFELLIQINVSEFETILKQMNLDEWLMTPLTVNAYYHFNTNSINFPVAILQSPLYSVNEQDYINYGSIGQIIGHELTHAFDNSGKLYDAEGHYKNWWTDNDNEEFKEYSQCFIDEYNAISYEVNNKIRNVDGEITLGENLADNGGLARAYDAWQLSLLKNPERAAERNKKLPGFENFTIDQLFYIAYGQSFCSIEEIYIKIEKHSPGIARINGAVANSKHFAKAFNCPTKSAMNPENKCLIW